MSRNIGPSYEQRVSLIAGHPVTRPFSTMTTTRHVDIYFPSNTPVPPYTSTSRGRASEGNLSRSLAFLLTLSLPPAPLTLTARGARPLARGPTLCSWATGEGSDMRTRGPCRGSGLYWRTLVFSHASQMSSSGCAVKWTLGLKWMTSIEGGKSTWRCSWSALKVNQTKVSREISSSQKWVTAVASSLARSRTGVLRPYRGTSPIRKRNPP